MENVGELKSQIHRNVIRSQIDHLVGQLKREGVECFVITACLVDNSIHLLGTDGGLQFINDYFLGVKEEFLPYLREQPWSNPSHERPSNEEESNEVRSVIKSLMRKLVDRLQNLNEESFVVTNCSPTIIGSVKGMLFCKDTFQGLQRAFARHTQHLLGTTPSPGDEPATSYDNLPHDTTPRASPDPSKPYKCVVKGCGKSFAVISHRREHYLSHTDKKLYNCDVCKKAFKNVSSVRCHWKTEHPGVTRRPMGNDKYLLEQLERELIKENDNL